MSASDVDERPMNVAQRRALRVAALGVPTLEEAERAHILRTLERAKNNRSLAACALGIDRRTLHRKLARFAQNERPTS